MHRSLVILGVFLLFLLIGCNTNRYIAKHAAYEVEASKTYIQLLQSNQFDKLEAAFDESVKGNATPTQLEKVGRLIPKEKSTSVEALGWNKRCVVKTCDSTLVMEYKYPTQRIVVSTITREEEGERTLLGLQIQPVHEDIVQAYAFTFHQKGLAHYIVFYLAIVLPLFTLTVLGICLFTKRLPYKWLWIILIFVGSGRFTFNWCTGVTNFSPFQIQLLSSSFAAQRYGPLFLSLSIPLGALIFLYYRFQLFPGSARKGENQES